jgi:hypothetical protein
VISLRRRRVKSSGVLAGFSAAVPRATRLGISTLQACTIEKREFYLYAIKKVASDLCAIES